MTDPERERDYYRSTTGGPHVVIDSACELLNAMVPHCSNLSKTMDET